MSDFNYSGIHIRSRYLNAPLTPSTCKGYDEMGDLCKKFCPDGLQKAIQSEDKIEEEANTKKETQQKKEKEELQEDMESRRV